MKPGYILSIALITFSLTAHAEEPLTLDGSAAADRTKEITQQALTDWQNAQYPKACFQFLEATRVDPTVAEVFFNAGICLDKIGKRGDAAMNFMKARDLANGNQAIIGSAALNTYISEFHL